MDNNPLVSILIPNYNKAPYLRETLDSIIAQTYRNWECIIVDDHSTDDSWIILQEYSQRDSRFQVFKRPDHLPKGGNICRNHAFELSKGEYVNWFDSDDVFLRFSLEERFDSIKKFDSEFVISNGVFWDFENEKGFIISKNKYNQPHESFLLFSPMWLMPGLLIKRSLILKNNIVWQEDIPYFQDIFYSLSLLKYGKYSYCDRINWIWRDCKRNSLGHRTKEVNSYFENKIISSTISSYSSFYLKNNYNYMKWFVFNKFYILGNKGGWSRDTFWSLIGFFDGVSIDSFYSKTKILFYKYLFILIYTVLLTNIKAKNSIFYRLTKSRKISPLGYSADFLLNVVLISNTID